MSKSPFIAVLVTLLCAWAGAQTTNEAAYLADVTKRANGMLKALALEDTAKADRLRGVLVDQYRNLRALHGARDAKLKDAAAAETDKAQIQSQTEASVKQLHEAFVTKLSAELTPAQVEKVKDAMTYNVVPITYAGFLDMLPELTETQKAYILVQLKDARELAMDGGSSKEKHAIFGKYKGRINNYLSKEGYDLKRASQEWAERRKAREAGEKQPAN